MKMNNIIKTTLMTVLLFSAQNGFSTRIYIPSYLLKGKADTEISELKKTVTAVNDRVTEVDLKVSEVLHILNKTQAPTMSPVVDLTKDEVVVAEDYSI